jgi:uridine kinase
VETDSDVRLARRLKRDISQRGRDIHGVMQQYENHVKPAYDRYIAPTMQHADIIVPRYEAKGSLVSQKKFQSFSFFPLLLPTCLSFREFSFLPVSCYQIVS